MKLYQKGNNAPKLFNLATDIRERTNVINQADYEGTAAALADLWNVWNAENTKASHIWGITSYEEAFQGWLADHKQERIDWVPRRFTISFPALMTVRPRSPYT